MEIFYKAKKKKFFEIKIFDKHIIPTHDLKKFFSFSVFRFFSGCALSNSWHCFCKVRFSGNFVIRKSLLQIQPT